MSLVSTEAEISINPENMIRLEELGYEIPRYYNKTKKKMTYKKGVKILIKVSDLAKTSPSFVNIECDYCGTPNKVKYKDYNNNLNSNDIVKKYSCGNCHHLKRKEYLKYLQENGLLKNGENGYWTIEENRINELIKYVEKYNYLDYVDNNPDGKILAGNIRKYEKDGVRGLALKAGYDLKSLYKIKSRREPGRTLEEIIKIIEDFIDINKRFPTQFEFRKTLDVPTSQLNLYGGIEKIKNIMNYNDKNDLIDDNGFKNRSLYEFYVAQFLIHNNMKSYLREQLPFPEEGLYRSDFTFLLNNDKRIDCEVWGYPKTDYSTRGIQYNKNKIDKINLYKKYNMDLISIEYSIFQQSYAEIQKSLSEIFGKYLDRDFKEIDINKMIPSYKLTNEELFESIMKYSKDGITLPRTETLKFANQNLLYEVSKRYKHYSVFAKEFSDKCNYDILSTGKGKDNTFWNLEKVFSVFDKMINIYGKILSRNDIKEINIADIEIKRIESGTWKLGGMVNARLQYYQYLINNNSVIPNNEIDFLKEITGIKKSKRKNIAKEKITEALNILKILKEVS
jgi:hypothetical protein